MLPWYITLSVLFELYNPSLQILIAFTLGFSDVRLLSRSLRMKWAICRARHFLKTRTTVVFGFVNQTLYCILILYSS